MLGFTKHHDIAPGDSFWLTVVSPDSPDGAEYDRLTAKGVSFTQPPTDIGQAIVAVFDDTCGNRSQLIAKKPATA